ncbi:MAG TPA: prolyl oligopeptidase family serine peptidase, partial [Egibacteraceae bacterium]|nr:prolyl oligopeptidase family serine peptidase [Egibacteraceae bacterium]
THPDGREAAEFPRQHARTRRFTLGHPRSLTPAPDGSRVVFLRSAAGDDAVLRLWVLDTAAGEERCVADPAELADPANPADDQLPVEERALRERTREAAGGIVAYATDRAVRVAAFALGGRLHVARLVGQSAGRHFCRHTVTDPRPDPAGDRVAYVSGGALYVTGIDGGDGQLVAGPDPDEAQVSWGLAEFIAAEEMGRTRGYWWSPDGTLLAVTRVDSSPVARWHVTDPAQPAQPPRTLAYPAAGADNADVALYVADLDGNRTRVGWDAQSFPYLVAVVWQQWGPLTLMVQSRDQKGVRILAADPDTGATRLVREEHDSAWLEIVPGVPRWTPDGRLVHTVDDGDTRKLALDGRPLTPDGLQIRSAVHTGAEEATVLASGEDPTAVGVWRVPLDGGDPVALTSDQGVHSARVRGDTIVLQSGDLASAGVRTVVHSPSGDSDIRSLAETPVVHPRPVMLTLGTRALRAALLLPSGHRDGDGSLPVLLDPYGGPHAQRVLQRRDAFAVSQWFAEAGFAVLVTDGRGSPARGPAWERALAGDLATAPLDDQIDALHDAAEHHPLDLERVAIRGWSFGGFLAAAAVLRRPDVFHAAVAGAPVVDWSLYDTHYTERYLGTPQDNPVGYRASSLLHDVPDTKRPLLLIHGLADDNVVAAHTLRLSDILLRHAHPHQVLPLTGVTHMTPQENVAENLLWLELAFLRDALNLEPGR